MTAKTFWDYFAESAVLQGFMTVLLWGTTVALVFMGREVPEILSLACGTITGFWFKTKVQNRTIDDIRQQNEDILRAATGWDDAG